MVPSCRRRERSLSSTPNRQPGRSPVITPADVVATLIVLVIVGGMFVLCGIVASVIAGAKGRSRLLGFALGAALGIFGIAGAMLLGEGADRARQKRIERMTEQRLMMEALGPSRQRSQLADEWDSDDEDEDEDWDEADILEPPRPRRRLSAGYRMLPGQRRRRPR